MRKVSFNVSAKSRAFTLMEALVSIAITALAIYIISGMITSYAAMTKNNYIYSCLIQSATSGLEAKLMNPSVTSLSLTCGGLLVSVNIVGNPPSSPPPFIGSGQNACGTITSIATYQSQSYSIQDEACNFGS
ncbi:prepilin-type N-terminal cleavage/methylation domain-containing protein [Hydrogenobaculum acidophilum]